jgi:hypothetical protein
MSSSVGFIAAVAAGVFISCMMVVNVFKCLENLRQVRGINLCVERLTKKYFHGSVDLGLQPGFSLSTSQQSSHDELGVLFCERDPINALYILPLQKREHNVCH